MSATTVFLITRDPFKPWKKAGRMLAEARGHGFPTLVCLDDQSSDADRERIAPLADRLVMWTSEGFCEKAYRYVEEIQTEFALILADDELPSPMLWRVAQRPPALARWGVPVIPVLGKKYDRPRIGFQERLVAVRGWRWVGGFEGHSEGARQAIFDPNPGAVVWHYLLEAPLEEREAKAARYARFAPGDHRSRLVHEDHPDELLPLPDALRAYLPRTTN